MGLSAAAVQALVADAERARSHGLVLLKDGRLVGEWYFGHPDAPIQTMSATKSVVGLAVGRLLETGALDSLGVPVAAMYPEWRQGRKSAVTVAMLLNHTSGLQNVPNAGAEIYPAPDAVRLALAAELSHEPGTRFSYNNKAVNLLGGIVERASGRRLDDLVHEQLLAPLCIERTEWYRDEAGNPHAMAGLELRPVDLAKLGQMMLDGGVWSGRRILSRSWIERSTTSSQALHPRAGLLWWLLPEWSRYFVDDALLAEWRAGGVSARFLEAAESIAGRDFDSARAFYAALDEALGVEPRASIAVRDRETLDRGLPGWRTEMGPVRGYYAEGFMGQYLVVLPAEGLVAVRMKRRTEDHRPEDDFPGFPERVLELFGGTGS